MKYWLTTHWPPFRDATDAVQRHVYLQNGTESVAAEMGIGDHLLIYESKTGRAEVQQLPDGTIEHVQRIEGRQGIVTIAQIKSPLCKRMAYTPQHFVDGTEMNWCWRAETHRHVANGFVPHSEVKTVLGFKKHYHFRGFGTKQSGLKELTSDQYESLVQVFKQHAQGMGPKSKAPKSGDNCAKYGPGGESQAHRDLKDYVAANPGIVLKEQSVTTFDVEFAFPTNDRADILLQDYEGRIIGVEIEIHQGPRDFEGMLQAVKYRHMAAVIFQRRFEESRSVLAAHSISPEIKALCKKYDVEAIEVSKADVNAWKAAGD